ncbi:MAG: peptide deformylase [Rhodobacteraceae bacterium]|nr:peptide deformylase [Paracoccaceae bacterium]
MSVRPFVMWPDARLRTPCEPVAVVDDAVRAIWADMVDTMEAMPGQGVGLAACQIGVMQRLAVVDASEDRGQAVRMANPVLIARSESFRAHEEASPNLPGIWARLERPETVEVRYIDEAGDEVQRLFEGLWSTSVQHQIDHLDGQVYIDRLSRTKRQMLLRRYQKLRKG